MSGSSTSMIRARAMSLLPDVTSSEMVTGQRTFCLKGLVALIGAWMLSLGHPLMLMSYRGLSTWCHAASELAVRGGAGASNRRALNRPGCDLAQADRDKHCGGREGGLGIVADLVNQRRACFTRLLCYPKMLHIK